MCVSHPCSPVLFDPRLVESMTVFAQSSPSHSPVVCGTLSLCFKLAPLFSNDLDRSLSLAAVCRKLFTTSVSKSCGHVLSQFQQMACSEDPELLVALCKLRESSSGDQDLQAILSQDLVIKLGDVAMSGSSRVIYRRLMAAFDIAVPLPAECHHALCQRVSISVSASLSSAKAAAATRNLFSTKVYAVLKCVADVTLRSLLFAPYFSRDPQFAEAVFSISHSLPAEIAQGESNLRDNDEDTDFVLVRTATASDAIDKLRTLTTEPLAPPAPSDR